MTPNFGRPWAAWLLPAASVVWFAPSAIADVEPYHAGPTRPFDGSPRTNYANDPTTPTTAPPTWRGFYIGAGLGSRWTSTSVGGWPTASTTPGALQGGLYAGKNFQLGRVVLGIESDVMLGHALSSRTIGSATLGVDQSWTASTRLRAGYAFGQALVYGTGGVALAGQNVTASGGSVSSQLSDTRFGTVFGAGVDYKFTQAVSARIEALHYTFNDQSLPWASSALAVKQESTAVRAGLSLHFD